MDPEAFPKLVGPHQLPPIGDSEELVPAEPGLERSREHFPAKKHPRSELPKTGVISGLQEVMDAVLLEAVVEGHRTAVYSQKRQTQPSARCGPSGHIRVEPARARMGEDGRAPAALPAGGLYSKALVQVLAQPVAPVHDLQRQPAPLLKATTTPSHLRPYLGVELSFVPLPAAPHGQVRRSAQLPNQQRAADLGRDRDHGDNSGILAPHRGNHEMFRCVADDGTRQVAGRRGIPHQEAELRSVCVRWGSERPMVAEERDESYQMGAIPNGMDLQSSLSERTQPSGDPSAAKEGAGTSVVGQLIPLAGHLLERMDLEVGSVHGLDDRPGFASDAPRPRLRKP